MSNSATLVFPAVATVAGIAGAALGLWLTGMRHRAQPMVPLTAGILLGVATFGLMPELGPKIGWLPALLLFAAGYGLLAALARTAHPVCPTCAHDHDHGACAAELHGFAGPLLAGAVLHSLLDGWSIASVERAAPLGLRIAAPVAIALHKLPEGIALGGIMRASLKSRHAAFAWCVIAEGSTIAGALLALLLAPGIGTVWTTYPLGITAGWLFYLAMHALHEEWKHRGPRPAFTGALAGVLMAAIIQRAAEILLR